MREIQQLKAKKKAAWAAHCKATWQDDNATAAGYLAEVDELGQRLVHAYAAAGYTARYIRPNVVVLP